MKQKDHLMSVAEARHSVVLKEVFFKTKSILPYLKCYELEIYNSWVLNKNYLDLPTGNSALFLVILTD